MDSHASPDSAGLAMDTASTIGRQQFGAWRRISSLDIAAALNAASAAGAQLAWYGMKDRFPSASDEELCLRIAIQRLGPDLAVRIHPDAASLLDH